MKRLSILLTFAVLAAGATTTRAADADVRYSCCDNKCHSCGKSMCKLQVECVPNEKECYEIECKQICVPSIRFPWMKCCGSRCGRVINVKVPKPKTYECGRKKVYTWKVEKCPNCGACQPAPQDTPPPPPPRNASYRPILNSAR